MDVRINVITSPPPPYHVITYIADSYIKQHEIKTQIK